MAIVRVDQLDVFQTAHSLVLSVYRLTATFPSYEQFGLVSQMRRAAVSVPANIAEGFKRRGLRDKVHFYNMSQGSLEEVRYYLRLSVDLRYTALDENMSQLIDEATRMLHGLIESIERRS